MSLFTPALSRPVSSIISFFLLFKGFLLGLAYAAALSPDYDTSTSLFFQRQTPDGPRPAALSLAHRLTRWDGIYFIAASRPDGLIYEQQWAFGPAGLPAFVSAISSALGRSGLEPLIAIGVAHVSHLVAVLALYHLTLRLSRDKRLALLSSLLHVVSPAGLFLSAPYAESPFACLSLLGHLLAVSSVQSSFKGDAVLVAAGVVYGISTLFRSNGLISGLLFAVEAVTSLLGVLQHRKLQHARRLIAALVGGICVAAGSIIPQFLAWRLYCGDEDIRPWCSNLVPSVYSFVQEAYWNVGFLRYWTIEQLPLFILAAPVLTILIKSGVEGLRSPVSAVVLEDERFSNFVRVLAASQTILAVLAITNYHVQIISRISSAYPLWYWWVAKALITKDRKATGSIITTFMVMYAGIQGGLFASFLPPA